MKKHNYLFYFCLFGEILLFGVVIVYQAIAQQPMEHTINKEGMNSTRIVILTSGPAEVNAYWLDEPFRLVVEFKSRNIVSRIGDEVVVNQGIIKRITSSYVGRGKKRSIKSLSFELTKKVPYKIHQENDTILLDIQTPLETSAFSIEEGNIFVQDETSDTLIKRLEAIETALMQGAKRKIPSESCGQMIQEVVKGSTEEIGKTRPNVALVQDNPIFPSTEDSKKVEVSPLLEPVSKRKTMSGMVFLFMGLTTILGLGLLLWYKSRLNITNEKAWIPGKSPERRHFRRIALSRDYSRTIILRVEPCLYTPRTIMVRGTQEQDESSNRPEAIKSFANNISADGLCFETKEKFKKEDPLNLKLFFYGDVVPMMKIQAHIIWEKEVKPINYYGVYFDTIDENDRIELNRYIESKIAETATEKSINEGLLCEL